MSVEKWFGSYGQTPSDQYAAKLKEAVELLCAHTIVTVDSTPVDTDTAYSAILHCAGEIYAQLSVDESQSELTFSAGYKSSGAYVSTYSQTWTINAVTVGRNCEVYRINGDDMWELRFPSGFQYDSVRCAILRATRFVSSVDAESTWAIGIYRDYEYSIPDYGVLGVADKILVNGAWYSIHAYESVTGSSPAYNIPAEKMMVFPALVASEAQTELGVPTVGGQTIYSMSSRTLFGINPYDEYLVNRQRFVSLGFLTIRSK